MARELPAKPVTTTDELLAHLCGLVGELVDRLPGKAPQAEPGEPVEIREPEPVKQPARKAPAKKPVTGR